MESVVSIVMDGVRWRFANKETSLLVDNGTLLDVFNIEIFISNTYYSLVKVRLQQILCDYERDIIMTKKELEKKIEELEAKIEDLEGAITEKDTSFSELESNKDSLADIKDVFFNYLNQIQGKDHHNNFSDLTEARHEAECLISIHGNSR